MTTIQEEIKGTKFVPLSITAFLVVLAIIYSKKNKKSKPILSLEDVTEKLMAFHPEPLVPKDELYTEPRLPTKVESNSEESFDKVQNLVCNNYLNLISNETIKDKAEKCVRNNGVGSCGPRGFYGTIDVHLDLECRIAEFMGLEEAVLYSYSLSTMSSAIIAYLKKGDVIFCDEKTTLTSIQAIRATKAIIICFKHNDVNDLERLLIKHDKEYEHKKIKARKFLLVEGIYSQTGKICPLPQLMALRRKYMLRMFLDECISFAALGAHGRGVTEHFNVDRSDIDLIVGSLEYGISSIGGFGVGSSFIIEHQRLSGLGYCFSASLPPFLSSISKYAIDLFEKSPELFEKLHNVCRAVHNELTAMNVKVISDPLSPKKVFTSKNSTQSIIDACANMGVIIDSEEEETLYFNINVNMDDEYISKVCRIIKLATA